MYVFFLFSCFLTGFSFAQEVQPSTGDEPAVEGGSVDESTDTYDGEDARTYGSDTPVYSTKDDEIVKLRMEMAEMKKKMQAFEEKNATASKASSKTEQEPTSSLPSKEEIATPLDPDTASILAELGVDTTDLKNSMGASTEAEATAMAGAYKSAGKMEINDVQQQFNDLTSLYKQAMASQDAALHLQFKKSCTTFIESHQDHSLSRSGLFYMAKILLKMNQVKEAQSSFARVYKGDEQGPHAADALLGMADVFLLMGNKNAALKFVEKVKKDFKPDYLNDSTKSELARLSQACGIVEKKQVTAQKQTLVQNTPQKPTLQKPISGKKASVI